MELAPLTPVMRCSKTHDPTKTISRSGNRPRQSSICSAQIGRRRLSRAAIILIEIAIIVTAFGCYRHVVRATGPGARDVDVHEPNLKNDESGLDAGSQRKDRDSSEVRPWPDQTSPRER